MQSVKAQTWAQELFKNARNNKAGKTWAFGGCVRSAGGFRSGQNHSDAGLLRRLFADLTHWHFPGSPPAFGKTARYRALPARLSWIPGCSNKYAENERDHIRSIGKAFTIGQRDVTRSSRQRNPKIRSTLALVWKAATCWFVWKAT